MPRFSLFRLPGQWRRRRARRTRMALQWLVLAILFIIFFTIYVVYKPPKTAISYLQRRYPQVLFHVPTSRKVIALTIDDAPTQYTHEIIEILKSHGASATFFTIGGQVAGREDLLEEILKAGSELGNHAMHDEPSISLSSDTLRAEIDQVDNLIDSAYAKVWQKRTMKYFRPGSGVFSDRILDVAKEAGHRTILGSIYPHDPFIKYWRINAWNILSGVRPGAIIICHDRRSWTLPMLRKVIPEIKRRGYEIVTVSELLLESAAS